MTDMQRVALVTGAAGGIGQAFVKALLNAGIRVAAVDVSEQRLAALSASAAEAAPASARIAADLGLSALAQGARDARSHLLTIAADLSTDEGVAEAIGGAKGHFGRVDILVNNAGVGQGTLRADNWQRPLRFWEVTANDWRRFVAVHTTAPLLLAQAVVPDMVEQKWGRIVNVTTSLGTMIRSGSPTYGPSKAALEAMSAIMAKDLEGSGVTVNVVVPGGVTNTGMVPAEAGFDRAQMIQPEVMAPPLVWLVSDPAAGVTGRRFLAVHWDPALPPAQAAETAGAPIAWTGIATMPIEPPRI